MSRRLRYLHAIGGPLLVLALSASTSADVVIRRGEAEELRGRVTVDDAGVTVRSETGARIVVPWDRVRDVQTDQPVPGLESHLAVAEDLWRARSRLERGDATMAESLFGELFARFRGQTHETALVAAEGLLRCCVARGAQAEAVIPALETIRLRRAGIQTASYTMLPPMIDGTTELCVQLPPFWLVDRNLLTLDAELDRYDAQGDRVVIAMASLLHRAVRVQLDGPPPEFEAPAPSDHAGLAFLEQVIDCAFGEPVARGDASSGLLSRLTEQPAWARAWARMALGTGLLGQDEPSLHEDGLVHLAYVPARHASTQPFLAGLALNRIKSSLESRGDQDGADAVQAEMERRFPGHPLLLRRGSARGRPSSQGVLDHA